MNKDYDNEEEQKYTGKGSKINSNPYYVSKDEFEKNLNKLIAQFKKSYTKIVCVSLDAFYISYFLAKKLGVREVVFVDLYDINSGHKILNLDTLSKFKVVKSESTLVLDDFVVTADSFNLLRNRFLGADVFSFYGSDFIKDEKCLNKVKELSIKYFWN